MMEAVSTSETSVSFCQTRGSIPEDSLLYLTSLSNYCISSRVFEFKRCFSHSGVTSLKLRMQASYTAIHIHVQASV
jgi:hypothetical protein